MSNHVVERRSFLLSSMAFGSSFLVSPLDVLGQSRGKLTDPLPSANLNKIGLDAFADDELDMPYHVAHFHNLANGVRMEEPNKGYIDIVVCQNSLVTVFVRQSSLIYGIMRA